MVVVENVRGVVRFVDLQEFLDSGIRPLECWR